MCLSSPDVPAPPPPPQPVQNSKGPSQEARRPGSASTSRTRGGITSGTMLTGTSGVATSALNTGGNSLLGS